MLDNVQVLTNVCDLNNFDIVPNRELREGSFPVDFYIRLFQKDLNIRYVPESGATLQIQFLRADTVAQIPTTQTITKTMTVAFAEDRSIWKTTLVESDIATIVSGGFRIILTEGADQTTLFVPMSITKSPSSNKAL